MDVKASSSSERPAEADLKQNKRCLDTEFYEEDEKPKPLRKKAIILQGNINKYVLKTSDEDKKKIDLTVTKFFFMLAVYHLMLWKVMHFVT